MLTKTENPKTRKQTYLSNKQKWEVASYCIEHRCVIQDIDPKEKISPDKFYPHDLWRVTVTQTVNEINKENIEGMPVLKLHHIKSSVEFFNEICELTGKFPEPSAVISTVEMDQLVVRNTQLENTIKGVQKTTASLNELVAKQQHEIEAYKQALISIGKLIPAAAFTKK